MSGAAGQTLTIWDSDAVPDPWDGTLYRWSGYAEERDIRSLLRYAETHGERLRRKYLAWIHDLGETTIGGGRLVDRLAIEEGLSYWWLTLIAEKSPYKSLLADAVRLLALQEIVMQERPARLRLVSADRTLHETLGAACRRSGMAYEWVRCRSRRVRGRRPLLRWLPQPVHALVGMIRHLARRWPLRSADKRGWQGGERAVFVCSYFDNVDLEQAQRGRFFSYYWQGLHARLESMGRKVNWLHIFIPCASIPAPRAAVALIRRFQPERGRTFHTFHDAYLSPNLLWRAIKRCARLGFVSLRLRGIDQAFVLPGFPISLWPLMRRDWYASLRGAVAVDNMLQLELFDAALCAMPHQATGLYLCENQPWERALIHAWRKHGHGRLVAVAHSTVRFWDLRYFADPRTARSAQRCRLPQPDLTVLNGKAAVDAYAGADYPADAFGHCEALRYSDAGRVPLRRTPQGDEVRVARLLVLGDYQRSSTLAMLRLLEAAASALAGKMAIVVKPHPNCPVMPEEFPSLRLQVTTRALGEILHGFDAAYTGNSTSAAVDAYLAGLPVLVGLDEDDLNFSPLRGRPGVSFVSTACELADGLQAVRAQHAAAPPDPGDFFFLDPALPEWSRLLAS